MTGGISGLPFLMLAVGLLVPATIVAAQHPRLALGGWIIVVCFVPVWLGVTLHSYYMPAVVVGIGVVIASAPAARGPVVGADLLFTAFIAMGMLPVLVGGSSPIATFPLLTETLLGYLVARLVAPRAGIQWTMDALTVLLGVVAILAMLEFVSGWNPFVKIAAPNRLYATWAGLQDRGGIVRAEGAFGHSIALGCSLAMAVPLALTRAWPARIRFVTTAVLLGGAVVSFSRTGILCSLLGVLLAVVVLRREELPIRLRVASVLGLVVAGSVAAPRIAEVFVAAGEEAAGSARYRADLTTLISHFSPLGMSPIAHVRADGTLLWGNTFSVDNTLILFGLRYGWIPLLIAIAGLLLLVLHVAVGRGSPAAVALVAQVPALITVALITQYGILLSFLVGLVVASYAEATKGAHARAVAVDRPRPVLSAGSPTIPWRNAHEAQ